MSINTYFEIQFYLRKSNFVFSEKYCSRILFAVTEKLLCAIMALLVAYALHSSFY